MPWSVAIVIVVFMVSEAVRLADEYYDWIKRDYDTQYENKPLSNDFPMFYAGATNLLAADRSEMYTTESMERTILQLKTLDPDKAHDEWWLHWQRYYNPPLFLLLVAPLTLLDLHTAFLVSVGLNLVAAACLCLLLGWILRWRQPVTLLVVAALIGGLPFYFTLRHAQPTLLIAVLFAGAFLATREGRGVVAACLIALMGAKPQWIALPALALLRGQPRAIFPLAVAGVSALLLPFVFLGPGAVIDYAGLLLGRGTDDLADPQFGGALLSWAGFTRALWGSPQPELALGLGVLTLAAFALVLKRGDTYLTWSAAAFTTLIVVPHSHAQDWVVAVPAAAILLSRPSVSPLTIALTASLLFASYWAVNDWEGTQIVANDTSVYWATPAAFAVILWCAALPAVEDLLRRSVRLPAPAPASTRRSVPLSGSPALSSAEGRRVRGEALSPDEAYRTSALPPAHDLR